MKFKSNNILVVVLIIILIVSTGCSSSSQPDSSQDSQTESPADSPSDESMADDNEQAPNPAKNSENTETAGSTHNDNQVSSTESSDKQEDQTQQEESNVSEAESSTNNSADQADMPQKNLNDINFPGYTLIEVEGGNLSGHREPLVVVDIGYGDREYYAFTNEYGQLVKVIATEIILQDEDNEPVLSTGRYYPDEAKVPGTESPSLDEGHIIADSLGGVANAYNITPQESTLNRYGDQAYMEKVIRDAGGCTDFTAIITYPNTDTQIPNHYSFTYTLMGNEIHDEFDNVNPDEVNATAEEETVVEEETTSEEEPSTVETTTESSNGGLEITRVSLSEEEVDITNFGDATINLEGYTILSVTGGQRFTFPSYVLEPGAMVTVYARGGEGDIKWSGSYIWNNDGDPAELYDPSGLLVDNY